MWTANACIGPFRRNTFRRSANQWEEHLEPVQSVPLQAAVQAAGAARMEFEARLSKVRDRTQPAGGSHCQLTDVDTQPAQACMADESGERYHSSPQVLSSGWACRCRGLQCRWCADIRAATPASILGRTFRRWVNDTAHQTECMCKLLVQDSLFRLPAA